MCIYFPYLLADLQSVHIMDSDGNEMNNEGVVGRKKMLKVSAKQGSQLAKEVVKKELEDVKEHAVQGVNALSETAVNVGIPGDMVHSVSNIAREGAHTAVDRLGTVADKVKRRYLCDGCSKKYASSQSLWNHKKRICQRAESFDRLRRDIATFNNKCVKPITLKWNGRSWETRSKDIPYQMNLGRDLSNLLERGAIKDDSLNSTKRENIQMYKSLFLD